MSGGNSGLDVVWGCLSPMYTLRGLQILKRRSPDFRLLKFCKALWFEGLSMYYATNTFVFTACSDLRAFTKAVDARPLALIRNVIIADYGSWWAAASDRSLMALFTGLKNLAFLVFETQARLSVISADRISWVHKKMQEAEIDCSKHFLEAGRELNVMVYTEDGASYARDGNLH